MQAEPVQICYVANSCSADGPCLECERGEALLASWQDCNLYLCEAAALQKEMEMALIMNVAALKLCCKESKEDACAEPEQRPWPKPAEGSAHY